jgi:hypothetical protein
MDGGTDPEGDKHMNRNSLILFMICALLASGASGVAQAGTIVFSDTHVMTTTNWNATLTFPKFNPSLGSLTGIDFFLQGEVAGNVRFESRDAEPTRVKTNLQAEITLFRPDNSTIVATTPVEANSDSVMAYDHLLDFGGTSGRTYLGLTASASNSVDSPPPASDLALFTGLGTIALPIAAVGTSNGSGSGNLTLWFQTQAAALGRVTYTYDETPPVPEASSLALLLVGCGFTALGGALGRLRKK